MTESRKQFRSSRTFRRLIVSYFIIFLIPFLVLCATTTMLISHYSDQETVAAHSQWVALLMEDVDRFEKSMTDIQNSLQYDTSIQSSYSPAQYTPSTQLIQKLAGLKHVADDVRSLWYIASDSNFLYSDTTTLSANALISWRYPDIADFYHEESFLEAVKQGTLRRVMKSQDKITGDSVLLFAYPLLRRDVHSYKWHYHYVMLAVPEERMSTLLGQTLTGHGIQAALYLDEDLLCQTADNAQDTYRSQAPGEMKNTLLVGDLPVSYSHTATHSLFRTENSGWRLEVSVQNAFAARRALMLWVVLLALIILCAGFYFSFLTARRAYAPIAHIKDQSAQLVENDEADDSLNDFAVINQHLLQLSSQREKLQQEMSDNTDVIENFLCYSLLYGHSDNLRSFQLPDSLRMQLDQSRLRVLFVLTSRSAAKIRSRLKKALGSDVAFWCTASARPEGVVVLLAGPSLADSVLSQQLQTLGSDVMLGLSSIAEEIRLIPLMTLQAVSALNRRLLAPGMLHFHTDTQPQLLTGQDEVADVGSLMQSISEPAYLDADKAYRLLMDLMRFLNENPAASSEFIPCLPAFLEPLHSVQEGRGANLTTLAPVLEKYVRPLSEEPVLSQMRRYIETHYMESEFSFKNMATDFSMSESGLSNYFKKHCGQSLMDCLTDLRIHQAINLLDNTDISIQDIGALVGYINPNSFIRRFKQLMQMTPGEYRRSHREE